MSDKSIQETYAPNLACFGCGPANPIGLHVRSFPAGDEVVAEWQPSGRVRGISRSFVRRNYRDALRLSLQLGSDLALDAKDWRRQTTVFGHGGVHDQDDATHTDGPANQTRRSSCRIDRHSRNR